MHTPSSAVILLVALAPFPALAAPERPVIAAALVDAATVPEADAATAARALIRRVLGARADAFTVEIIPAAEGGKNVFELASVGGKIRLRGDTGVSVASALNHYLKHHAHAHLSWCGDQLDLPAELPPVKEPIRVVTPHACRVMFNYCTLNYTCSWWDRARWERELDFLAMNGINAPLGVLGLEGVWYNTLLREGFTDAEARAFLVGPAFGAWQWMTNIEGHGGPVSKKWIAERVALGKFWMARARELGMTPIRQGFSGYVPRKLKEKRPGVAVAIQESWCGFPGSAQLDPTDPYFQKIGATFMEESLRLFGADDHLWAADPFHESAPPKPGEAYLNEVGRAIHALMKRFDPKATWAMQAWSIRKGITDPVPKGELLVLDLSGQRSGFWGHNYVKGQLHNFGGRINLHGDLRAITGNPFARAAAKDPCCQGMGLFPEAIVQNPVFYDAVYDAVWRTTPAEPLTWLAEYAHRRYGKDSPAARAAWKLLLETGPYRPEHSGNQENSSMIAARPALVVKKSGPNQGFSIPYPQEKLLEAVELLLGESDALGSSDGYRYDCVDFTRQVLANHAQNLQHRIRLAYLKKDRAELTRGIAAFHGLLADTDALLATRKEFLFGKWLADARASATSPEEAELFARNATQLLTLWGPAPLSDASGTNAPIYDYSWREWSGLIGRHYLPRWQRFHAMLEQTVDRGDYRDPAGRVHGREALRANALYSDMVDAEIAFINHPPKDLPAQPAGDGVALARALVKKYRPEILAAVADNAAVDAENEALLEAVPAGKIKIGAWKPERALAAGKTLDFDASAALKEEGAYAVTFDYRSGGQRLDIEWVALLVNGTEVMRDTHPGTAGTPSQNHTYRVATGGIVFNGQYTLRAQVKSHGGHDSAGLVLIEKVRP